MIVYIVPVALFVVTLIIILAFRAEDKKSRSLQTVKEKISMFRTESQQTMARINETSKDASERVEAKKKEVMDLIASLDSSLDNLANHKNDLVSLESICRSYEVALDKLRVQTEHAEDRIRTVQAQVEKAQQVNDLIESFRVEARAVEQNLGSIADGCRTLEEQTAANLRSIADSHQASADEMLSRFSSSLENSRQDFNAFASALQEELDGNRSDFRSYVSASLQELEDRKNEVESQSNEAVSRIESEKDSLSSLFAQNEDRLAHIKEELENYRSEIGSAIESDRSAFEGDKDRMKPARSWLQ